jgi:DNA invertase Pin-like site-specific DNA recombinase
MDRWDYSHRLVTLFFSGGAKRERRHTIYKEALVNVLYDGGMGVTEIARRIKSYRSTVYWYINSHFIDIEQDYNYRRIYLKLCKFMDIEPKTASDQRKN